jgi:hypothetical protein
MVCPKIAIDAALTKKKRRSAPEASGCARVLARSSAAQTGRQVFWPEARASAPHHFCTERKPENGENRAPTEVDGLEQKPSAMQEPAALPFPHRMHVWDKHFSGVEPGCKHKKRPGPTSAKYNTPARAQRKVRPVGMIVKAEGPSGRAKIHSLTNRNTHWAWSNTCEPSATREIFITGTVDGCSTAPSSQAQSRIAARRRSGLDCESADRAIIGVVPI